MSTKEDMQYYIGEGNPRNKDCVTILRSEYVRLVSIKNKTLTSQEIDSYKTQEMNRREKAIIEREERLSMEKYKISARLRDFSKSILKQIDEI